MLTKTKSAHFAQGKQRRTKISSRRRTNLAAAARKTAARVRLKKAVRKYLAPDALEILIRESPIPPAADKRSDKPPFELQKD